MAAARFYSSTAGTMELQASITALSTTMTVDSTTGLPGTTPFTVVIDPGLTEEIVDVTNVSGVTLTITRGVDGSPAQTHAAGAQIRHMATARDFRDAQEHIGTGANVHGVGSTSSVVGTDTVQTLKNKTAVAATAGTIGLLVKGAAAQTASIIEAEDSTGLPVFKASTVGFSSGGSSAAINTDNGASLFGVVAQFVASTASVIPLILKRIVGQTANLLELRNESDVVLAKFDKDGKLTAPQVTSTGAVSGTTGTFSGAVSGTTGTFSGAVSGTSGTFTGQTKSNNINVVTLTEAQTLDNKSLTAPTLTGTTTAATVTASGPVTAPNLPASSTTKAGKRLHWGTSTQNTGASGLMTVTHGAGFTPTSVLITPSNIGYQFKVDSIGATTFQVQWLVDNSTAAPSATSMVFFYLCGE